MKTAGLMALLAVATPAYADAPMTHAVGPDSTICFKVKDGGYFRVNYRFDEEEVERSLPVEYVHIDTYMQATFRSELSIGRGSLPAFYYCGQIPEDVHTAQRQQRVVINASLDRVGGTSTEMVSYYVWNGFMKEDWGEHWEGFDTDTRIAPRLKEVNIRYSFEGGEPPKATRAYIHIADNFVVGIRGLLKCDNLFVPLRQRNVDLYSNTPTDIYDAIFSLSLPIHCDDAVISFVDRDKNMTEIPLSTIIPSQSIASARQ